MSFSFLVHNRYSKVSNLYLLVPHYQKILRLHISIDDVVGMKIVKCLQGFVKVVIEFVDGELLKIVT